MGGSGCGLKSHRFKWRGVDHYDISYWVMLSTGKFEVTVLVVKYACCLSPLVLDGE